MQKDETCRFLTLSFQDTEPDEDDEKDKDGKKKKKDKDKDKDDKKDGDKKEGEEKEGDGGGEEGRQKGEKEVDCFKRTKLPSQTKTNSCLDPSYRRVGFFKLSLCMVNTFTASRQQSICYFTEEANVGLVDRFAKTRRSH